MNKDRENELSVEARIHLHISDTQIKREMLKCQQLYFVAKDDCEDLEPSLGIMLDCLKCTECGRIPLELQECSNCMAIICKACEADIMARENPRDRRCPDPDCDDEEELSFQIQEFSSKMMIKQLEENFLMHTCCKKEFIKQDDKGRINSQAEQYNILELFDHLLNVCLKKQNICPLCGIENESIPASWEHMRKDCPKVKIECDMCDQVLTREDFIKHQCYCKSQDYRDAIEEQDGIFQQLSQQNKNKKRELSYLITQRKNDDTNFANTDKDLKGKLACYQEDGNNQFLTLNDFKIDHSQRKQRYTSSTLQTPFYMHKYKININTCFNCSHDQLIKDMGNFSKLQKITGYIYFEKTKRMTEYSAKRGFDGKDIFCSLCNRECTYISDNGQDNVSQANSKALTFGGKKGAVDDQDAVSEEENDHGVSNIMAQLNLQLKTNLLKNMDNNPLELKSIHSQALPNHPAESINDFDPGNTITSKGVYFQCNGDCSCQRIICDLCQQIRVREFETRPQLQVHKLSIERELYRIYGSLSSKSDENKIFRPLELLTLQEAEKEKVKRLLNKGILSAIQQKQIKIINQQQDLKKSGSEPNVLDQVQEKLPELPKRRDSVSSQGSITGYNIRANLKSGILGLFSRAKAKKEEENAEQDNTPTDQNISPYADHNINHGVMFTPDGAQIDTNNLEKGENQHLYPNKDPIEPKQSQQSQKEQVQDVQDDAVM